LPSGEEALMADVMVGLIGGTGLDEALSGSVGGEAVAVQTPFGDPSGEVLLSEVDGCKVAILARHGAGHRFHPSDVPYRANVYALKKLGCTHIIASGATGSLREQIHPGELVVPDQVIDKTYRRVPTFFDGCFAGHVEFSEPFCPLLRAHLLAAAEGLDFKVHDGGTYVCMEGPAFSSKAESLMHREWGGDLIGMTCMPEAKLAREAEIAYALVAFPTDYDCWRPHEPGAQPQALLAEIMANLQRGRQNALALIRRALASASKLTTDAPAHSALSMAIWTDRARIDRQVTERLGVLVAKYF
jgi:5'-methylthioadenosine phosphorylase